MGETALPQGNAGDFGFDAARLSRIDQWMESYVSARKFAGLSLMIARRGTEVFYRDKGLRDVENNEPFQRDTVARIYSMTKPITSLAAMMLLERGLIHLDQPLSDFLPEFSAPSALVPGATRIDQVERCACPTLHQILTHTSGFSYSFNEGILPEAMEEQKLIFGPTEKSLARTTERLAELPLAFQPGQRWEYSVGIDVIGRVIELVTGRSLAEVFAEEIFAPLGMSETSFDVPEVRRSRFAALFTPLSGGAMALNAKASGGDTLRLVDTPSKSPFLNTSMHSGGGGLTGTIDDYMRFAEMLRNRGQYAGGRLVSPQIARFMMSNHLPGEIASMGPTSFAEQPMTGMGFGLGGAVVLDPARARMPGNIGDFSWGGMASTFFWVDPVADLSVVFFTQLSPSSSYPSRAELKALVHGALVG